MEKERKKNTDREMETEKAKDYGKGNQIGKGKQNRKQDCAFGGAEDAGRETEAVFDIGRCLHAFQTNNKFPKDIIGCFWKEKTGFP